MTQPTGVSHWAEAISTRSSAGAAAATPSSSNSGAYCGPRCPVHTEEWPPWECPKATYREPASASGMVRAARTALTTSLTSDCATRYWLGPSVPSPT